MTIDIFLEKQKEYNLKYTVNEYGCLRSEDQLCPICELAKAMGRINLHSATAGFLNCMVSDIAHALDLSSEDSHNIILEADGHSMGHIRDNLINLSDTPKEN